MFGKSDMAAAVKKGKAKAKAEKQASGKFKLIGRGKNANKSRMHRPEEWDEAG